MFAALTLFPGLGLSPEQIDSRPDRDKMVFRPHLAKSRAIGLSLKKYRAERVKKSKVEYAHVYSSTSELEKHINFIGE
jgi:hypothetical protein